MVDVHAALGGAGLRNVHVREYVRYWAELTGAARIEVVSASDDARLIGEGLADQPRVVGRADDLDPCGPREVGPVPHVLADVNVPQPRPVQRCVHVGHLPVPLPARGGFQL